MLSGLFGMLSFRQKIGDGFFWTSAGGNKRHWVFPDSPGWLLACCSLPQQPRGFECDLVSFPFFSKFCGLVSIYLLERFFFFNDSNWTCWQSQFQVAVKNQSCGAQADFRKTGHAVLGPDSRGGSSYWRIQALGVFIAMSSTGCLMYLDVWSCLGVRWSSR